VNSNKVVASCQRCGKPRTMQFIKRVLFFVNDCGCPSPKGECGACKATGRHVSGCQELKT
jgi:hypothetical protein